MEISRHLPTDFAIEPNFLTDYYDSETWPLSSSVLLEGAELTFTTGNTSYEVEARTRVLSGVAPGITLSGNKVIDSEVIYNDQKADFLSNADVQEEDGIFAIE